MSKMQHAILMPVRSGKYIVIVTDRETKDQLKEYREMIRYKVMGRKYR